MYATSWKAKGLLQPIWERSFEGKAKREQLAAATDIPATNLSGMNTGRLVMTLEMANRIIEAVPGLTLAELGAPLRVVEEDPASQLIQKRLETLERKQETLRRRVARVEKVQSQIEEAQELLRHQTGGQG